MGKEEQLLKPTAPQNLTYVSSDQAAPTGKDYQSSKWHLLTVIEHHMPNGWSPTEINDWREQLRINVREIEDDNPGDDKPVLKYLVGVLSGGLDHGNWPWVRQLTTGKPKKLGGK